MISQTAIKEYMETVMGELEGIKVEEGSNNQSFKTMIKMTSRLRYVKIHLLDVLITKPEKYKILYDSMKIDEAQINIYRGILGLAPLDF